jgi:hypothetical protein
MGRHETNGINENGEMFLFFLPVKKVLLEELCLYIKKYIKIGGSLLTFDLKIK